jgi:hypothetical protein
VLSSTIHNSRITTYGRRDTNHVAVAVTLLVTVAVADIDAVTDIDSVIVHSMYEKGGGEVIV